MINNHLIINLFFNPFLLRVLKPDSYFHRNLPNPLFYNLNLFKAQNKLILTTNFLIFHSINYNSNCFINQFYHLFPLINLTFIINYFSLIIFLFLIFDYFQLKFLFIPNFINLFLPIFKAFLKTSNI